ncbi:18187_t:CDS:2 [Gigaspora margarita]|uniref:18187_t:CDS:1 n=1 Tax=Gigaspora margarita TaxID=4874 RepID=A0ABN7VLL8_GIGMA|nr:18187_t:CDS:2 [Gigaspora margarita]
MLVKRTQSLGAKARHFQKHISEIRSLVRHSKQITNDEFRKKVRSIFSINKKSYSSNTIWLVTNILQVGQTSLRSTVECMKLLYEFLTGEPPKDQLSTSTLRTWYKGVSELHFNRQIYQLPIAIIAQLQNITKCNAETVSDITIAHIQKSSLGVKKCALRVTDNTSYMSGDKKGAVTLFNKKTNGYKPLNINSQIIKTLYDGLLGFHYNQYQLPLRARWDLEIRFAEELEDDLKNGITYTFGLHKMLLQDDNLRKEFEQFCNDEESFLRLSSSKIDKENLLEGLKEIKTNRKKSPLQETQIFQFGPDIALDLYNNLLC